MAIHVVYRVEAKGFDIQDFDNQADALKHEALLTNLQKAMDELGPDRREELDFQGANYLQHDQDAVNRFIGRVYEALTCSGDRDLAKSWALNPRGIVERALGETNHPAFECCRRLHRIDSHSREWAQRCFAQKPEPNAVEISQYVAPTHESHSDSFDPFAGGAA